MTFIIRDKQTHQQWIAKSGARVWNKSSYAKAAFTNSYTRGDSKLAEAYIRVGPYDWLKFDQQDVYEIVELDTSRSKQEIAEMVSEIRAMAGLIHKHSHTLSNDARKEIYTSLEQLSKFMN
ncbi:hypothetical protein VmeM32_00042 [Vibrio phage vB_VmeM-32]|nr:hypothetical protein VmeM32_00042 [Vibrio phage vB_VmeM-32]